MIMENDTGLDGFFFGYRRINRYIDIVIVAGIFHRSSLLVIRYGKAFNFL
jgi:hypothetical protein